MSDAPELKPCPFCGGKPYLANVQMVGCAYVICTECSVQSDDASRERAIALWNRRDPATLAELPEVQAMGAAAYQRAAYVRTGIKDNRGREICEGDTIRVLLSDHRCKEEYWNPEYKVVFKAPSFTLSRIGGGKNSDTAHFIFRTAPSKIETLTIRALIDLPAAAALSDMLARARDEGRAKERALWVAGIENCATSRGSND
jgi:Lar family restriction alleviation protein